MRHDDYIVTKKCKMCGKPIMEPKFWSSNKNKDGNMKRPVPKHPTCNHVQGDD